jgi:hypothetical protein
MGGLISIWRCARCIAWFVADLLYRFGARLRFCSLVLFHGLMSWASSRVV